MNKTNLVLSAVCVLLLGAVVALYVLFFTGAYKPKTAENVNSNPEERLPIAYVNLDSILANYNFAIDANDQLMSKQEDATVKLNTRARSLQNEMNDFQRKLDNNAFLSRERAESEYNKLQKKQLELQELEAKLTQDLLEETQKLNLQLRDTVDMFLKEYNADGKYQLIFANTAKDNILVAQPGYDITTEVVDALNARYTKK